MNRAEKRRQQKLAKKSAKRAPNQRPHADQQTLDLALQHLSAGRLSEAAQLYKQVLQADPNQHDALHFLGTIAAQSGNFHEAVDLISKAIAINPNNAAAHSNHGNVLKELNRLNEAVASYQQAIAIKPDFAEAHGNLGIALKEQGKLDDAIACYRKAIAIKPGFIEAHGNLIFAHNYVADHFTRDLLDEACKYGEKVAAKARPISTHSNSPDPDRRLRVGLVSGDFRQHPVGYFLVGFLADINSDNIELFAYTTSPLEDDLTTQIKSNVSHWRNVVGVADAQLVANILDDEIDILVDLSGHTAKNRLPLFAWKPAPVQATWLGYFATTGVKEIDYILCDRWVLPPEEEDHFVETPMRLPDSYLCFSPPKFPIDVAPLPAKTNGFITFGCFNNLTKINDAVIACWSQVLLGVADSRLFLKSKQLSEETTRQDILKAFSHYAIPADRLIFEGKSPRDKLLETYNQVDICLDPFPYPGGTTSVEALWMGVPVLTVKGDRFVSHVGESILHTVGLDEWVASSPDEYVEIAKTFASDLPRLAAMRGALRERLITSPMCDASLFARNLESAFRDMWSTWCSQQGDQ